MSRADLRMERREKRRESMGMEGRQATLPRESSTQEEDRDWSQGRVSIPLDIIQSIRVNWSVDSIEPAIDLSSVVFCSNSKYFSLSLFVVKLFLRIRIFMYIRDGRSGKNITNLITAIRRGVLLSVSTKYFLVLVVNM